MTEPASVVDCAGASMGGAANFLRELDSFLNSEHAVGLPPQVIGRSRQLTSEWLIRREFIAKKDAPRIALNNVSFAGGRAVRTVLLRNALHFASEAEMAEVGHKLTRSWRAQTLIVRAAVRRADRVIVPCHAMSERVQAFVPEIASRMVVRPHPVSTASWAAHPGENQILVPVLAAPYKQMPMHVDRLLRATEEPETRIVVTGSVEEYPQLARHPRVKLVGRLSAVDLEHFWATSAAVYFPTTLESFGYPLAQARANGRRVLSPLSNQTQEIAGSALAGFVPDDHRSLATAAEDALSRRVAPDRDAFNPIAYFNWLFWSEA